MSNRGCHRFQIKLSTLSLTDRKGKSQNILIFVCSWLLFRAPYVGLSSVGRAQVCGTWCREFDPRRPTHYNTINKCDDSHFFVV